MIAYLFSSRLRLLLPILVVFFVVLAPAIHFADHSLAPGFVLADEGEGDDEDDEGEDEDDDERTTRMTTTATTAAAIVRKVKRERTRVRGRRRVTVSATTRR